MEKFIEFLELDTDATWLAFLALIAIIFMILGLTKLVYSAIGEFKFYKLYGVSLNKYCKEYDISDADYAFEHAARKKEYEKVVYDINRNDFLIPETGITMEQACKSFNELYRCLNGGM